MTPERWSLVEELFARAAELSASERAEFLSTAAGDDADLRRAIERLLAEHDRDPAFLESPPPWRAAEPSAADELPERIGEYRILRRLGGGGMGQVFLAEREAPGFRQQVALKVMRRGLDTDNLIRRFRNERQILANLDHPNIARLLNVGATDDGLPYFVMEYVEGATILDHCDRHRLTVRERLTLFGTVCSAVQHAHQSLVVHRDLKPGNILVTERGVPKLLDFGIAKILDPERNGVEHATTRADERLLTPEYAAPEQLRGDVVTTACDVHALGVLLYELLSGRHPYTHGERRRAAVTRRILEVDPEPPSRALAPADAAAAAAARSSTPDALRRALAGDLDTIVLKALRKEPDRRYVSALSFADDVRRHLDGVPVEARPATVRYRLRRFVHGKRVPVAAALVLLLAGPLVTMIAVERGRFERTTGAGLAADQRAGQRPRVIVAPLANRTADARLDPLGLMAADWITQGLVGSALVEVVPAAAVLRSTQHLAREAGRSGESAGVVLRQLAQEYGAGYLIDGTIYRSGDSITVTAQVRDTTGRVLRAIRGVSAAAADPVAGVRRLREQVIGALATVLDPRLANWSDASSQPPSLHAYQLYSEGLGAYLSMDWLAASDRFRSAAALDSAFTAPLVWAVRSHFNSGRFASADSLVRMIEPRRAALAPWDRAVFDYFAADLRGDKLAAYQAMRRAVAITPGSEWVYHLGVAAHYANRPREAARLLASMDPERGWLAQWRPYWPILIEAHHSAQDYHGELAQIARFERARGSPIPAARLAPLAALGRTEEATSIVDELIRTRRDSLQSAGLIVRLARELQAHGHAAAARPLFERALMWLDEAPRSERTRSQRVLRATVLFHLGRFEEARPLLDRLHAEEPAWPVTGLLGQVAAQLGDYPTARRCATWFTTQSKPSFYGEDMAWRAGILSAMGDGDGAAAALAQAYDAGLAQSGSLHVHPGLEPLRGTRYFEARMQPGG